MGTPPPAMPPTPWPCSRPPSPGCPERTIPSTPRFPSLDFLVTARLTEVTTLTPRLSARSSTSALLTEPEVWPSTASSVPTEPSSTRTTSSATGGSTSTVPRPRVSTASTMSTLPRGPPWTEPPVTLSLDTPPLLNIQELKVLPALDDRDLLSVITAARDSNLETVLVNATSY